MNALLNLVYKHRQLSGQCSAGIGLSMTEVETLCTIESLFGRHADRGDNDLFQCQREFVRENVELSALMRNGKGMVDHINVTEIEPNGMVCTDAPYVEEGTTVELMFDDPELLMTYRFKAVVKWLRDGDDDNFDLGLQLVGVPLLIRRLAHQLDELERVAA